jgi:hypothetical protein
MKRLYKATYSAVILVEPEESLEFARALHEDSMGYVPNSLSEIKSEADIPTGWKITYSPIEATDGAIADDSIRFILEKLSEKYISEENLRLKARIEELEKLLYGKTSE